MSRARRYLTGSFLVVGLVSAGCTDPTGMTVLTPSGVSAAVKAAAGSSMTVTAASPSEGARQTTLDVTVSGSGFDATSLASFALSGTIEPRMHVNRTRYVSATQIVANVTIAADAPTAKYDVVVQSASGKKGIGSEMFTVFLQPTALAAATVLNGVNANGDAVGQSTTVSSCSTNTMPVLWRADGTQLILPTGTHCGGTAWAINNSGVISGQLFAPAGSALWIPQPDGSYVVQDLGATPDGTFGRNTGALNDAGVVLGWNTGPQIFWRTSSTPWMRMITPPGATQCSFSRGINSAGEIVGRCQTTGSMSGYYWHDHDATPVLLPRPANTSAAVVFPMEINDSGVIVGYISTSPYRALRWIPSGGAYPTVEYLPDTGTGSLAYGIANDGTISGVFQGTTPRAVLWWSFGGYTLLHYTGTTTSGEAYDVALTPGGSLVAAGYQGSKAGVRWRPSF